jgi:hypothetical protein
VCGGDPRRLRSLSVRFARPVLPGQTLVLEVWDQGAGSCTFATRTPQGEAVIVNGQAVVTAER